MTQDTWRSRLQRTIHAMLAGRDPRRMSDQDRALLRKEFRKLCPVARQGFAYAVWCQELRRAFARPGEYRAPGTAPDDPRQMKLFEEET